MISIIFFSPTGNTHWIQVDSERVLRRNAKWGSRDLRVRGSHWFHVWKQSWYCCYLFLFNVDIIKCCTAAALVIIFF